MPSRRNHTWSGAGALRLASAMASVFIMAATLFAGSPARAATRPNFIVIMTDDQRWDTLTGPYASLFPNIEALMSRSTYLPNAFVPNSLCCPSRTSTLSGLYSHTTGVYGNSGFDGGFQAFNDGTTIATALQQQGYETSLVGKYLNGYPRKGNWPYVPPGWDNWFAIPSGSYYDYRADIDGTKSALYGTSPADYSTKVLTHQAIGDIASAEANSKPYLVYYAITAPHRSAPGSNIYENNDWPVPAPRDYGSLDGFPVWRPASFGNRDDTSDMPPYISHLAWDAMDASFIDGFRIRQLESLVSADRQIGILMSHVNLSNTFVLFMSDNGLLWGEHRWTAKDVPYEEAIRVPMFFHMPRQTVGKTDTRLALNVDVAYTIAGLAGVDPTTVPIGADQSGAPALAEGESLTAPSQRTSFVLEHSGENTSVPPYCGVRTADGWMFSRYADGFEELYDVGHDPLEQTNLTGNSTYQTQQDSLRLLAQQLCSPVPPGYSW